METTFMTIHNLNPEATILYASQSVVDVLGYEPEDIIGRSCFDYFHPEEVPFARNVHSRGIQLDKAASLHYARIKGIDGQWIGCECVFTVVYDILVACTSIYGGSARNERRAIEAPAIRRLFSSSPRDPRYHMLEHLSAKFRSPPRPSLLEPRAALILNRFTRTLTVMYATNAVADILGVSPEVLDGKSFYECMQENCLPEAIRCLESAKANDSIAYLRFWYRDPRHEHEREDEQIREASQSSDSEDGGVELGNRMDLDSGPNSASVVNSSTAHRDTGVSSEQDAPHLSLSPVHADSLSSSENSLAVSGDGARNMFDSSPQARSSTTSADLNGQRSGHARRATPAAPEAPPAEPLEIEAVVSCTSDGLVVILRRARPILPSLVQPVMPHYQNGLFAAPWGVDPIQPHIYQPNPVPFQHGFQAPQYPSGPPIAEFMVSIREVAVFAWSLAGINGNIAEYGHGTPRGEAQPATGLPVWNPYAQPVPQYQGPENQAAEKWARWAAEGNELVDDNNFQSKTRQGQHSGLQYGQQAPTLAGGQLLSQPQRVSQLPQQSSSHNQHIYPIHQQLGDQKHQDNNVQADGQNPAASNANQREDVGMSSIVPMDQHQNDPNGN